MLFCIGAAAPRTIFDLIPVLGPGLAPNHWSLALRAVFFRQIGFLVRHERKMARRRAYSIADKRDIGGIDAARKAAGIVLRDQIDRHFGLTEKWHLDRLAVRHIGKRA